MAVNERKFGARIVIGSNSWHTYDTWGLILTNGEPIGDPEIESNYINIPGRNGLLDASEAITGEPTFKGRPINMEMAVTGDPTLWERKVSTIRNLIDGRTAKITFDDVPDYYWLGRISVRNADRAKRLGKLTIYCYADAHKYENGSAQEDILWDDVDFETTIFRYIGELTVSGSYDLYVEPSDRKTVPVFTVSDITSETFTVKSNRLAGKTFTLHSGRNRFPELKVCGPQQVKLTFTGSAKVSVEYRGGSL